MQHRVFDKISSRSVRHKMQLAHVFGALLLIMLVAGIQALAVMQSRDQFQERTRLTAQNLGNVLAESIGGFFRNVDITLLAVIDQARLQERNGSIEPLTFDTALETMRHQVPGLTALRVTDPVGVVKFGTGMEFVPEFSVAQR